MRKIESQMNSAIRSRSSFSSANTSVVIDDNNAAYVYLHGNHIATIDNDNVTLFDGGWQSNTTKSRLNAILQEFAYGVGVFQSSGSGSFVTKTKLLTSLTACKSHCD